MLITSTFLHLYINAVCKLHSNYLKMFTIFMNCWNVLCAHRIRKSTYTRLAMVESGPLGSLIEELTLKDELHPLLTDEHIQAINRRLAVVMQTIELCAKVKSWDHVLVPY